MYWLMALSFSVCAMFSSVTVALPSLNLVIVSSYLSDAIFMALSDTMHCCLWLLNWLTALNICLL